MAQPPFRIAIVGAGFSGAMAAVHLLRQTRTPIELMLFDRRGTFGRGLAYSARNPQHLLNVRVANMSAFDDDPQHFIKWLWQHDSILGDTGGVPPSGHAFVSRSTFGAYVEDVLHSAIEESRARARIVQSVEEVVGLRVGPAGPELGLEGDRTLAAHRVVLCTGNIPPSAPFAIAPGLSGSGRYIADPWNEAAIDRIGPGDSVLAVGTGLTMVDVVIDLVARGHRGPIRALSRRGLLPHVHEQTRSYPLFLDPAAPPATLLGLMRRVRGEVRAAEAREFDWRSVMDSIRPIIQDLWRALPPPERRRFLRHLRPYWDIHRHRMAPQIARDIDALRASGKLAITAGRIAETRFADGKVGVAFRPRGGGPLQEIAADWMINCSGPESDYGQMEHPLIRDILERGLARRDSLSLGFEVAPNFALIGGDGAPSPWLFALGPPTRGAFWESTAVPDIRKQCARFAASLVANIVESNPA